MAGRGYAASGLTAAALCCALVLAGCAVGAPDPGDGPSGTPTPSPAPTAEPVLLTPLYPVTVRELLEYCPGTPAQHFDGLVDSVTEVYVCSASDILSVDGAAPGAEVPGVQRASRVTGGADELLLAYSEQNAAATTGACIELAADPLIVWTATADGITAIYAPVDECGFPTRTATDAFNAVALETILEVRLGDKAPAPTDPSN